MNEDATMFAKQLSEAYERQRIAKAQRKDIRKSIEEDCKTNPRWEGLAEDKKEASDAMKLIKLDVMQAGGYDADLADVKMKIEVEQDVIDGCIAQLMALGSLKPGEQLDLGDLIINPTIKVNLHAQMKLGL